MFHLIAMFAFEYACQALDNGDEWQADHALDIFQAYEALAEGRKGLEYDVMDPKGNVMSFSKALTIWSDSEYSMNVFMDTAILLADDS